MLYIWEKHVTHKQVSLCMIPTEVFGVMFSKRERSSYLLVKAAAAPYQFPGPCLSSASDKGRVHILECESALELVCKKSSRGNTGGTLTASSSLSVITSDCKLFLSETCHSRSSPIPGAECLFPLPVPWHLLSQQVK